MYELYTHVITEQKHYYAYDQMESLRARMLLTEEILDTTDFGTGGNGASVRRPVRYIASRFASPRRYAQLLFRLVNRFRPHTILEVGTSLGITTGYLAMAHSGATVITLEGCPETARLAQENFKLLRLGNIQVDVGEFSQTLPAAVGRLDQIDFAYLDGNHRKETTLDYFHRIVSKVPETGVLVLDDIHWSRGMEEAWEEIKRDARVTTSIDLYQMGILFFQHGLGGQHFMLKY